MPTVQVKLPPKTDRKVRKYMADHDITSKSKAIVNMLDRTH